MAELPRDARLGCVAGVAYVGDPSAVAECAWQWDNTPPRVEASGPVSVSPGCSGIAKAHARPSGLQNCHCHTDERSLAYKVL